MDSDDIVNTSQQSNDTLQMELAAAEEQIHETPTDGSAENIMDQPTEETSDAGTNIVEGRRVRRAPDRLIPDTKGKDYLSLRLNFLMQKKRERRRSQRALVTLTMREARATATNEHQFFQMA